MRSNSSEAFQRLQGLASSLSGAMPVSRRSSKRCRRLVAFSRLALSSDGTHLARDLDSYSEIDNALGSAIMWAILCASTQPVSLLQPAYLVPVQPQNTRRRSRPTLRFSPYTRKLHGEIFVDEYFWMRERTNPAVRAHLERENASTITVMKPTAALQKQLYKEIIGRIQETDDSVPAPKGDRKR
jgi:hypothetical protein